MLVGVAVFRPVNEPLGKPQASSARCLLLSPVDQIWPFEGHVSALSKDGRDLREEAVEVKSITFFLSLPLFLRSTKLFFINPDQGINILAFGCRGRTRIFREPPVTGGHYKAPLVRVLWRNRETAGPTVLWGSARLWQKLGSLPWEWLT